MEYDPAVTERFASQGTFISYTFQAGGYDSLVELRAKAGHERLMPDETARRDALEAYYDMKLEIFRRLLGDRMHPYLVVSSDAGPFDCEFGRMHYGLELAVQAGMSPLQAHRGRDVHRRAGLRRRRPRRDPRAWQRGRPPRRPRECRCRRPADGRRRRRLQGRPQGRRPARQHAPADAVPAAVIVVRFSVVAPVLPGGRLPSPARPSTRAGSNRR